MTGTTAPAAPDPRRLSRAVDVFLRETSSHDAGESVDVLLEAIAASVAGSVGVSRCSIHMRDDDSGVFVGAVCHGGSPSAKRDIKRSRAGCPADGMTREMLETRRCVVIENAERDPRAVQSTVRFWGIRSIMAAPMQADEDVIGLILLDDENTYRRFSEDDAEIARVLGRLAGAAVRRTRERCELRNAIDHSQRQLRALRRANAVDERLSDMVLDGQSLQALVEGLAEMVGKPCALFGRDGSALVSAAAPDADELTLRCVLDPRLAGHPDVAAALAANDGSRAFVVGPLPRAGVVRRQVIAPVVIGGETWGHLAVIEHRSRLGGGDLFTARRAATLVALQVGADRRIAESEEEAQSALAAALASGDRPALIQRRADRLGLRLDRPRLAVGFGVRAHGAAGAELSTASIAAAFGRLAPELPVPVTPLDAGIVALVDADASPAPIELVAAVVAELGEVVAGVSSARSGIDGYRTAIREAGQVMSCLQRFGRPGGPSITTADRLGGGLMFLATADRDLTLDFAETTLGWLVEDAARNDLLSTLTAFFANSASIRRCAIRLGVHENTIRYRLGRIEELSGLGIVHDPDALVRVRLALHVLELQGRLAEPGIAPALTVTAA